MTPVEAATDGLLPLRVQSLGGDFVRAVNKHVDWASGCMPVFADEEYDTQLLFTYCHRVCDDALRDPMQLNLLLVDQHGVTKVETTLRYSQSRRVSVREVLGKTAAFRGVCFAWTKREGSAEGFRIGNSRLAPVFYAFYTNDRIGRLDCV